ncbi:uncharacterized protein METZ01_LOCUS465777, partial [marine metagenome]
VLHVRHNHGTTNNELDVRYYPQLFAIPGQPQYIYSCHDLYAVDTAVQTYIL